MTSVAPRTKINIRFIAAFIVDTTSIQQSFMSLCEFTVLRTISGIRASNRGLTTQTHLRQEAGCSAGKPSAKRDDNHRLHWRQVQCLVGRRADSVVMMRW